MYYGLQATGMDAGMAGNYVQLVIFLGICVGWIGSYLFRVANKVRESTQGGVDTQCGWCIPRACTPTANDICAAAQGL